MRNFTIVLSFLLNGFLGVKAQQQYLVESYGIASSMNYAPADGDIDGTYLEGYHAGGQAYRYEMKYSDDFTKYGLCFLQLSPLLYDAWDKAGRICHECEEVSSGRFSWMKDCDPVHSRVFWMKETGCYLDSMVLDEGVVTYVRVKCGMFDTTSEGSKKEFILTMIIRESDGSAGGGRVVGGFTFVLDNSHKNGVEEVVADIPARSGWTQYSLSGIRNRLQTSGITIVRLRDGSVRKVVSK